LHRSRIRERICSSRSRSRSRLARLSRILAHAAGIYFQRAMWSDSRRRRENSARCRMSRYHRGIATKRAPARKLRARGGGVREGSRKTRSRARLFRHRDNSSPRSSAAYVRAHLRACKWTSP
jgi:hypothetical protein